jgi:hypothetical protein
MQKYARQGSKGRYHVSVLQCMLRSQRDCGGCTLLLEKKNARGCVADGQCSMQAQYGQHMPTSRDSGQIKSRDQLACNEAMHIVNFDSERLIVEHM